MALAVLQLRAITGDLPAGLKILQADAASEGFRFLDRLANDWNQGTLRFDRPGERLLAAYLDDRIAGVGGLTLEPAMPGALRMRRFYVAPAFRRHGVARALATALLDSARALGMPVTVNAGTIDAPAFWEAMGFARVDASAYTHVAPAMPGRSSSVTPIAA